MGRHAKGLMAAEESWEPLGGPDPGDREDELGGPRRRARPARWAAPIPEAAKMKSAAHPDSQAMSSLPHPGVSITQ
jgi:hypothetical protein